jgi:hypothetical protein
MLSGGHFFVGPLSQDQKQNVLGRAIQSFSRGFVTYDTRDQNILGFKIRWIWITENASSTRLIKK